MSELSSRLWPEKNDQPAYELELDGITYHLTWDNSEIKTYRTGIEEYDEELKKHDHLLHEIGRDGQSIKYIWIGLETLGNEVVETLIEKGYPLSKFPKLDEYVLEQLAASEAATIPEAIGPDFGRE